VVNRTIDTNDRSAETFETLRRTFARLGHLLRPAKLSTIQESAIQADVTNGVATVVGEWMAPIDLAPRPGIRFTAAQGLLSSTVNVSTTPRELRFTLETGETANGVDDDNDGLIDEGALILTWEGTPVVVADQLEICEFATEDRLLRVTLQCARLDRDGHVCRAVMSQTYYLRNN
jgi:hypothetical protein